MASSPAPTAARTRPRVEGEREVEILEAVLQVLAEVGYDRLTFDTVAAAAKASKATLYRRWPSKVDLVVEAVQLLIGVEADQAPDTGSLRGDLIGQACARGGLTDRLPIAAVGALLPAMHRDEELLEAIQSRLIGPKLAIALEIFRAAQRRGEIGKNADLQTLAQVLPALCMHQSLLLGRTVSQQHVTELVDTVVLPACAATLRS